MADAVLVTGGAGYIGSTTVHALKDAGLEPVVLDSLVQGRADFVKNVPFYQGDIADPELLEKIFNDWPTIGAVIHFAARIDVEESVREPTLYYSENTAKTLTLAAHAAARGVSRFIFSSTAAVYRPKTGDSGLTEEDEVELYSPYAASKWMAERMLSDLAAVSNTRVLALRYFNPVGADPQMRCGPYKEDPTHILGRLTGALRAPGKTFTVFGDDYPTRDGTALRDYVHVWDLAQAHVQSLHYLKAAPPFTLLNLGSGSGVTVREFAQAFQRTSGTALEVKVGARRPGDNAGAYASTERAEALLGWTPRLSVEQGIRDALRWDALWRARTGRS